MSRLFRAARDNASDILAAVAAAPSTEPSASGRQKARAASRQVGFGPAAAGNSRRVPPRQGAASGRLHYG